MSIVKRVVSTSFWEDDKVIDSFTPEDKYFMLYLLTNPHTKQIGIYPLNVKQAAFETGYSVDSINHLLERFESKHAIIKRSKITSEIAIKNYLCYSVVKGGKPVIDLLEKELNTIKDKSLVKYMLDYLKERDDLLDTVKSFVNYHIKDNDYDIDNDKENDNDNDNDNDSTLNVRSTYGERTLKREEKKEYKEKNNLHFSNNEELTETLQVALEMLESGISKEEERKPLLKLKWDIQCFKLEHKISDTNQNMFESMCNMLRESKPLDNDGLPF